MGRVPCCEKEGLKKGPWTPEEDQKLIDYIQKHGYGNWRTLPKNAGLQRCGKSCRLRWTNYLRPDIKRGRFSFEEEETIIQLHNILGNKWSAIASRLPGRTDNEIKNYWNTHIRKRLLGMGIDPVTHAPRLDLLNLSSILASSLYGSSRVSMQRLLGMQPMLSSELLKLASSLTSSQNGGQQNHFSNNPQVQNQLIPHLVQIQDPVQQVASAPEPDSVSLPLTQAQSVEPNVDPYPSYFNDFSSPSHTQYSQPQLSDDWHRNEISSSAITEDYDHLSIYNNYYGFAHHGQNLMEPPLSETSTFLYNNNNQNFSFTSVLSTPSSSPTPLNSNSTCINGSSNTEDERESYGSSNVLKFEIPHILDANEFMHVM